MSFAHLNSVYQFEGDKDDKDRLIKFYERLIVDMREENQRMRDINKELLLQLNEAQTFTTSLIKEGAPSGSSSINVCVTAWGGGDVP